MKLIFSWYISDEFNDDIFRPDCNISEPYSSLGAFLNDDGGLGVEYLKKWLSDGITEIDYIKKGIKDRFDMWGQHWGADITTGLVTIYWGYDDNELETIVDFLTFDLIIRKWYEFICQYPQNGDVPKFTLLID